MNVGQRHAAADPQTRGVYREWEFPFPVFPWESHGNGNGQCIIWVREWQWELLCGNGREWE